MFPTQREEMAHSSPEQFLKDVLAQTGAASPEAALEVLRKWDPCSEESVKNHQNQLNLQSESVQNSRRLHAIYSALGVEGYEEAVDKIADLKRNYVDPLDMVDLKSKEVSAGKDVRALLSALEVEDVRGALQKVELMKQSQGNA